MNVVNLTGRDIEVVEQSGPDRTPIASFRSEGFAYVSHDRSAYGGGGEPHPFQEHLKAELAVYGIAKLPAPREDTIYIVSAEVFGATDRRDVVFVRHALLTELDQQVTRVTDFMVRRQT